MLRLGKLSVNQAQDSMGYSTFVRGALQTYMVAAESGRRELSEGDDSNRRRFGGVDRAVAYEKERRR
jgi:hypothetical protein